MNALLLVLEGAWVVTNTAWLVVQRRSPVATLAWALVLSLLPLVGLPLRPAAGAAPALALLTIPRARPR
jgi:cardiolipin synthase A/B